MDNLTRKSVWGLVRQAKLSEDCNRVLTHHNMSLITELKIYSAVVLTSLLCGCESWTIDHHEIRQLEKFPMWALCSILGIWWQDKITNLKVLDWSNSTSGEVMLLKAQLHWAGHIIWMGDECIPKQLFFWWISTRTKKTRPAMKALQRHTEEQPEIVWHQAFQTQHNSPGPPPLACTHMHSKFITGKGVMSRTACSPQSSPESCFCPCHSSGLPVCHLPLTLQIQTWAAEPFQSTLIGAQTKSSFNSRDNHHFYEIPLWWHHMLCYGDTIQYHNVIMSCDIIHYVMKNNYVTVT